MVKITEEPLYTHGQLIEMIEVSRNWALNNPNGPLPHIPLPDYTIKITDGKEQLIKYNWGIDTRAKFKRGHWILRLLFKHVR